MATSRGQKIGIWLIAGLMAIGTIGSFAVIVLANQNGQRDQERANELTAQYKADVAAQEASLSEKHFETVNQFAARASEFDGGAVAELNKQDLVVGTGETLTSESTFSAYYIGWTPDGKVFDSSLNASGDGLKAPFEVAPGQVIKGWTDGVVGMKVGGARELTIPSELAYGEYGSGSSIPPNTPLKFVVFVIPTPKPIEIPQELINYYERGVL